MPRNANDLTRRRVYTFFAMFVLIASAIMMAQELNMLNYFVVSLVPFILGIVILVFIMAYEKKTNFSNLNRQNNIIVLLFIIVLIFEALITILQKANFLLLGESIISLIVTILAIVNRFV